MEKRGPGRPRADREIQTRKRRPMSIPMRKLEFPERPGFHRHIINDVGGRLQQALDGGYTFVDKNDVQLNEVGVTPGNADLGSRVSTPVGTDEHGKAIFGYLMEIPQEWFDEDQKVIHDRNDQVDKAILGGKIGVDNEDASDRGRKGLRYTKDVQYQTNFRPDPRR